MADNQGLDVLADIMVAGLFPERLGAAGIIRQGRPSNVCKIISVRHSAS